MKIKKIHLVTPTVDGWCRLEHGDSRMMAIVDGVMGGDWVCELLSAPKAPIADGRQRACSALTDPLGPDLVVMLDCDQAVRPAEPHGRSWMDLVVRQVESEPGAVWSAPTAYPKKTAYEDPNPHFIELGANFVTDPETGKIVHAGAGLIAISRVVWAILTEGWVNPWIPIYADQSEEKAFIEAMSIMGVEFRLLRGLRVTHWPTWTPPMVHPGLAM